MLHFAILPEQNHAAAILAAIPKDRRVLGLYFLRDGAPAFSRAIWTHFEGFHTVLGGGDTGQSFLDVESCPIHYRKGMSPPRPPANLEIAPEHYDPDAPYARAFDVLLVRSVTDPRRQLLGARADQGRILAGIGLFWVIDTAGLGVGPTVSPPGALP